jgi:hypothetical protein
METNNKKSGMDARTSPMPGMLYVLDADNRVHRAPLLEWAEWFETATNRVIGQTHVGRVYVSTVFLGIDHSFGVGRPVLFETMVFGGPMDGEQWRWETYTQAQMGHRVAVASVKNLKWDDWAWWYVRRTTRPLRYRIYSWRVWLRSLFFRRRRRAKLAA